MIPHAPRQVMPAQLVVYQRGVIGTGAIPGAGVQIIIPTFKTHALTEEAVLNPADNSSRETLINTQTHAAKRYIGLWFLDVWIFQNGPATLELRERQDDAFTQTVPVSDTTRSVWTRQIRTSIPFRTSWRLAAPEVRLIYTNGAIAITQFHFSVVARAA